ncbi:MAG: acetate kinase [bacterium]
MNVLVINAGSSSVKYALVHHVDEGGSMTLAEGIVERIGGESTRLKGERYGDAPAELKRAAPEVRSAEDALKVIAEVLTSGPTAVIGSLDEIHAVGHRVVHGGDVYADTVIIDEAVKDTVRELAELAPLHNPPNLLGIEAAERLLPGRPHAAVFDTAFHSTMPPEAYLYGIPLALARERRIRRYGFHGTSHKYVSHRAVELLGDAPSGRIITAHIGNGASLAAVRDGRSIDTTMGFTPLEGVMMGTRSGTVDPALPLYLIEHVKMAPQEVDRLLNRQSGLLGVAGIGSGDLRDVLEAADAGNEDASTAFALYVYRIVTAIGALSAALGGLDALVFTAGAGENSPALRAAVCERLGYLGIALDPDKNGSTRTDGDVSAPDATCRVLVITTQEDEMIARETLRVLEEGSA